MSYKKLFNNWRQFLLNENKLQENSSKPLKFIFTPEAYLKLTTDSETLAVIKQEVEITGDKLPLNTVPTLNVEINNGIAQVKAHDGKGEEVQH